MTMRNWRRAVAAILVGAWVVAAVSRGTMDNSAAQETRKSVVSAARPGPARIEIGKVGVIVIDPQPAFVRLMAGEEDAVIERLEQLYVWSDVLQLPIITTFERPTDRNGTMPERLEKVFPAHGVRFEKNFFDLTREAEIAAHIKTWNVTQIVVAGAETDVCVLQSVLGLIAMGFEVFLLEDCIFSNEKNIGPALDRMYGAGAIPSTYKTFYFETVRHVGRHPEDDEPKLRERFRRLRSVMRSPYQFGPSPTRDGVK